MQALEAQLSLFWPTSCFFSAGTVVGWFPQSTLGVNFYIDSITSFDSPFGEKEPLLCLLGYLKQRKAFSFDCELAIISVSLERQARVSQ